ncbi:exosortase-associated EpsI family protein, partial [Verrucomicrobiota bacterium]
MVTPPQRRFVTVVALMGAAAVLVFLSGRLPVAVPDEVRFALPSSVGAYEGEALLFCRSEKCLREFLASELEFTNVCAACGGALGSTSLAEKRILPADTVIRRKCYVGPTGRRILVTVVLSGVEQKSIHRPQQCLPAQGHVIEGRRIVRVPMPGREPLDVMMLDLRRRHGRPGGEGRLSLSNFAYWFVSGERETPYHLQRLFRMSWDRIVRNKARRWT